MSSQYGSLITPAAVEQAITNTLRRWIHDYLGEIERRSGGRWQVGQIRRPRAWDVVSDIKSWPEARLPAIIVQSATKAREPQHGAGGQVNARFAFTITVLAKGTGFESTRRTMLDTATAVEWILEQNGDLDGALGGQVAGVEIDQASWDAVQPERARTLAGAQIPVVVAVSDVMNRIAGPLAPTPPDEPPPPSSPEDPLHTSTHVHVTEE